MIFGVNVCPIPDCFRFLYDVIGVQVMTRAGWPGHWRGSTLGQHDAKFLGVYVQTNPNDQRTTMPLQAFEEMQAAGFRFTVAGVWTRKPRIHEPKPEAPAFSFD